MFELEIYNVLCVLAWLFTITTFQNAFCLRHLEQSGDENPELIRKPVHGSLTLT